MQKSIWLLVTETGKVELFYLPSDWNNKLVIDHARLLMAGNEQIFSNFVSAFKMQVNL